jgi:hypothetical protein
MVIGGRYQVKLFSKHPTLLLWATTAALIAARCGQHGSKGFHNW